MYRVRYLHSHISEELTPSVSKETEFHSELQIRTCSVQEFLFLSLLLPLISQNLCKFPVQSTYFLLISSAPASIKSIHPED